MLQGQIIAVGIFVLVMAVIVSEKIHRAVVAMAGAILMIVLGIIDFDTSISYIDFNTIGVLTGMMMFVGVVEKSGLFEFIAIKSAKIAKGNPWRIMIAFAVVTAMLSALLDNVTTVLLIGPVTFMICKMLNVNPVPYLMIEIMSSNIGGTSTLIGDPPNIMIGSATGLNFLDFISNLSIPVIAILFMTIICFRFLYGRKFSVDKEAVEEVMALDEKKAIKDKGLFKKSVVMIVLVALGFVLHGEIGLESSVIALSAAAIMLIISRQNVEEIVCHIEWPTILFFIGLFVVVGGLEEEGIISALANFIMTATNGQVVLTMLLLLWISAVASSILDNIPFVATLIPVILTIEANGVDATCLWWALSLGACLGGNGTLIGASANVVLSGISKKEGYPITFLGYLKLGFPMMLLSVAIAMIYLLIRF